MRERQGCRSEASKAIWVTWVFDVSSDYALDAWTVAFGPSLVTAADCPFADASAHLPPSLAFR
jgi:hypothetical protein